MTVAALSKSSERMVRQACLLLIIGGGLVIYPIQHGIDLERGADGQAADVLYVPSGSVLRRLCTGHEGLLADIYWTRVVQYFGRRRLVKSTQFELLGPLLRITTELDPQLIIAYRFGSIFLAEKPPGGAGEPEQALQLLRQGIVANPDYWRLWEDLGFIYYWDLKDYASAARMFQAGSEMPGALVWMKVLAASVAARGGEAGTSRLLWLEIYRAAGNDTIRNSAEAHLAALDAQGEIQKLNVVLARYREKEGHAARSFQELVAARWLLRAPKDPSGVPYLIGADGQAGLGPQTKVDINLLR